MTSGLKVGGQPLIELRATGGGAGPRLTRAVIAPGRAMMLLQLAADIPGLGEVELVDCPPLALAAERLSEGDPNTAFAFGGAILAPFANRLTGRVEGGFVHADIQGRPARIPANGWEGRYAIHGLVLDRPTEGLSHGQDRAAGRVAMNDPGRWPSSFVLSIAWRLDATALFLAVEARNTGAHAAPMGLGWHPYFTLPSGRRDQARLQVPARARVEVDDYQSVLPTGQIAPVEGTPYDFSGANGAALGDLYLDDCFVDLGAREASMADPLSGFGLRLTSNSPQVKAVQVYAPPDRPIVVIEPQFNLADPFGEVWNGAPNGMVVLQPGETVRYEVATTLFEAKP